MADGHVTIDTSLDVKDILGGITKIQTAFHALQDHLSGLVDTDAILKTKEELIRLLVEAVVQLVNALIEAINYAADFEQGIAKASTLFRDVQVDVDNLTESILDLSMQTGKSTNELLEGLYKTLSASIPVTEDMAIATGFLTTATKLSIAGFADETRAVETLAKIINAYNMDVSEANRVASILIETQNKGITTVGELGTYFAQAAVSAAEVGVALEQVAASVALLTANGVRARMASTYTRQLILELDKSSSKGAKALRDAAEAAGFGEMSFRDFIEAGWTLADVVRLISQYTQTMGINLSEAFSSSSALQAAQALADGADRYATNLGLMTDNLDALDNAYKKVTDTYQMSMARIDQSQKALMTAWGMSWMNLATVTATSVEKAMRSAAEAASGGDVIGAVDGVVSSWVAKIDGFFLGLLKIISNIPTYVSAALEGVLQLVYGLLNSIGTAIGNFIISAIPNLIIKAVAALIDMLASVLDISLFGWEPLKGLTDAMHGAAQTIRETYVPTIQELQSETTKVTEAAEEADAALKTLTVTTENGDVVIPWDEVAENLREYKEMIDNTDEAEMKFIGTMALLDRQQEAWGDRIDLTSQKLTTIKKRLAEALEGGADVDSPQVQALLAMYDSLQNTDTVLQNVQQAYTDYNDKLKQNAIYYKALNDETGLYNAQVNATQTALLNLIRLGVDPADAGFQKLLADLQMFTALATTASAADKANEILENLSAQLDYADHYLEVFGDAAEASSIKVRAYTNAIESLIKLDYDGYVDVIAALHSELAALVQDNDAAADIVNNLGKQLELISAKQEVFGNEAEATQEKINAYRNAIVELLEAGLSPTSDIILQLATALQILQNSLDNSITGIEKVWQDYDKSLDDIAAKHVVFGSSYNYIRAEINAVEQAINDLIANGIDLEDEKLQNLIARWNELTKAQQKNNMMMNAWKAGASTLVSGLEEAFTALYEGENAWNAFAKAGLDAIAAVLESLAQQLAIQALASIPNWGQVALLSAGAVAAAAAAALVKSWAGTFATGGIVKGPYNGHDNLTASVKAGEVILNHAQAINTARLLESMEGGVRGNYVAVNFNGVVLGTKKEISKYVYDGIRESQSQGVLKKW